MAEKSQCGANTYPAGTDWHGNSHTTHEMNQRCYLVTWDTSSNSADVFLSVRWYPFFSGLVRAHVTPPRFGPKFWQLVAKRLLEEQFIGHRRGPSLSALHHIVSHPVAGRRCVLAPLTEGLPRQQRNTALLYLRSQACLHSSQRDSIKSASHNSAACPCWYCHPRKVV